MHSGTIQDYAFKLWTDEHKYEDGTPGQNAGYFERGYFDATALIVIVTSTTALYNSLELLLLLFAVFEKYAGLYFWSLLIASAGVIPYAVSFILVYFKVAYGWVGISIDTVGWVTVVTGQIGRLVFEIASGPPRSGDPAWRALDDYVQWRTLADVDDCRQLWCRILQGREDLHRRLRGS